MTEPSKTCEYCISTGGDLVWGSTLCRVASIVDPDYPGFTRVILNQHRLEMTDLEGYEQLEMMRVVFAVEATLRKLLNPDKINLASLGNITPHVHWHVIPRWREDRCFPNPIWGSAQRTITSTPATIESARLKEELADILGEPMALSHWSLP